MQLFEIFEIFETSSSKLLHSRYKIALFPPRKRPRKRDRFPRHATLFLTGSIILMITSKHMFKLLLFFTALLLMKFPSAQMHSCASPRARSEFVPIDDFCPYHPGERATDRSTCSS